MGICCSKKSPSTISDSPIQKNKKLKPKIDKNPEKKTVFEEKPIMKGRKSKEIDRTLDEKQVQKNPNPNPKSSKIPEETTEIEEKPILKHRKGNKTHFPIDEKDSNPSKVNPNPNSQIDKNPDEKTENGEKPFIKHRISNETDRQLDKKHISLVTNRVEDSNLITNTNARIDKNADEKTENKEKPFIKHRKSNETDRKSAQNIPEAEKKTVSLVTNNNIGAEDSNLITNGDEVDAILIQCGRLSRCSSENADMAMTRESRRQSPNRRRTPGRERGEKERDGSRRVSKSPGKRLEGEMMTCRDPISRPGKMVSVPATDKEGGAKRGRSRSPVIRGNNNISRISGENHGKSGDFSRNVRKAERSPYRRNPLGEIDQNTSVNSSQPQKRSLDNAKNSRTKTKQQPTHAEGHAKAPSQTSNNDKANVVTSGPQALTRTRSSKLSQDLDNLNIDAQNTTSYTALLLEDIQSFHNKNPVSIPLPQCLSKTCSILDQIADLNSNKGTEGLTMEKYAKKLSENKEPPLLETEVVGMNDLLEPSFQKYRVDEGEESTGSNIPQHWISSSLWETNSIDSNSSMKFNTRDLKSTTKGDDRKKREIDCHKMGIGQGKASLRSGLHLRSAISTATI